MSVETIVEETVHTYDLNAIKRIFLDVKMSGSYRKTEIKFPKEVPYGQGIWTSRAEEFVVTTVCLPKRSDREHSAFTFTYAKGPKDLIGKKAFNVEYMFAEEVKHDREDAEAMHNKKIAELKARYETYHGTGYIVVEKLL